MRYYWDTLTHIRSLPFKNFRGNSHLWLEGTALCGICVKPRYQLYLESEFLICRRTLGNSRMKSSRRRRGKCERFCNSQSVLHVSMFITNDISVWLLRFRLNLEFNCRACRLIVFINKTIFSPFTSVANLIHLRLVTEVSRVREEAMVL